MRILFQRATSFNKNIYVKASCLNSTVFLHFSEFMVISQFKISCLKYHKIWFSQTVADIWPSTSHRDSNSKRVIGLTPFFMSVIGVFCTICTMPPPPPPYTSLLLPYYTCSDPSLTMNIIFWNFLWPWVLKTKWTSRHIDSNKHSHETHILALYLFNRSRWDSLIGNLVKFCATCQ